VQFNWIPLHQGADVMDLLASVDMHGIQTSGNCIRNITSDARAGIAEDEIADPAPLPRSCASGARCTRSSPSCRASSRSPSTAPRRPRRHRLVRRRPAGCKDTTGELGFKVLVGGGMGRTPVIASVIREFLPWNQILNYLEAVMRVYNRWGRRDNKWTRRASRSWSRPRASASSTEVEEEYRADRRAGRRPAHHHAGRI
jgi:sulfite reductase (NADPH) hemoprotein beta-component